MKYVRWSTISCPGRLKRAASMRSASAKPTALPTPWPSGPVVVSTPGGVPVLGMARRARAPLPELLQVLDGRGRSPRGAARVLQHAGVAGREHEAVAIGPRRVGRVVPHRLRYRTYADRRERHRRAGVAGVRLLDASMASVRMVSIARSWIGFNGCFLSGRGRVLRCGRQDGGSRPRPRAGGRAPRGPPRAGPAPARACRGRAGARARGGRSARAAGCRRVAVHPGERLDGDADGGQRGGGARRALVAPRQPRDGEVGDGGGGHQRADEVRAAALVLLRRVLGARRRVS